MINGNTTEFVDKLWSGEELIYVYNGKKYFSQGYVTGNGENVFELQMWEPEEKTLWRVTGKSNQDSYEEFMKSPLLKEKHFGTLNPNSNGLTIKFSAF